MGDFNAKIGSDNKGYEEIMGKHGIGEMNENGERFADLCATNSLVIGGSVFPHKRIHKATWISPDLSTENQIDHVCITKCVHHKEVPKVPPRCMCQKRSGCRIGPPFADFKVETEA